MAEPATAEPEDTTTPPNEKNTSNPTAEEIEKGLVNIIDKFEYECCTRKCGRDEQEFANYTSCHGLERVANVTKWWNKTFWVLATLTVFTFMITQFWDLFSNYAKQKPVTIINLQPIRTSLDFPAVTICDVNRFNANSLKELKIPPDDSELINYLLMGFGNVPRFDHNVLAPYNQSYGDDMKKRYTTLTGLPWNYSYILEKTAKKNFSENLIGCFAISETQNETYACNLQKYFRSTWTKLGECLTFNHKDIDGLPFSQHHGGSENGFYILYDLKQDEYSETMNGEIVAGLVVYLHARNTPGQFVTSYGIYIPPGTSTSAAIRKTSTSNIRPKNGGTCRDDALKNFSPYSQTACEVECMSAYISQKCGCIPVFGIKLTGMTENTRLCEPDDMGKCVMQKLYGENEQGIKDCVIGCEEGCQVDTYDVQMSYAVFPGKKVGTNFATKYKTTVEYIRENYIMINFYYPQLQITTLTKEPSTSQSQLLSDIGGQMGLCVGASLLTLCEFGEYMIRKLLKWILNCRESRNLSSDDDDDDKEKPAADDGDVELNNVRKIESAT